MNLVGLNSNRYLVNNRIPITITGEYNRGSEIVMSITRNSDSYVLPDVKLYPSPNGLRLELSEYIKGLMPTPYIPGNSYTNPIPNTESFNISFSDVNDSETFLNKTFIRGGRLLANVNAQTISINQRLSPVERVPLWSGFPNAVFWLDSGSKIRHSTVVDENYKLMRPPKSCNPFYIRFLNSLGGYSFWLFNSYEIQNSTTRLGRVENSLQNRSLGFSVENTISADTRVGREFFPLMQDLLVSPVVEQYEEGNWRQVFINANTFTTNNYEDLVEITCEFDLSLNYTPGVIW